MEREREGCKGDNGSEEREEASGRARAWEGSRELQDPRLARV